MAPARLAPLLTAVFGLTFVACSGSEETPDGGSNKPTDSGVDAGPEDTGLPPADAGFPDTGPRDCTGNPFRCAPMQLMDSECVCLEECEGALRWNPATGVCEMPPAGECNTSMDCDPGAACIDVPNNGPFAACAGQATCRCLVECNPWVSLQDSRCPPDYDFGQGDVLVACTWLGGDQSLPEALCLPQGMGGEQAAACTDPMQCNRQKNYFCTGRTNNQMTGACGRLCDSTLVEDVCTDLGDYECVNFADPMLPELGFCAETPAMDVGTTCTSSTTCQGELCSAILAGSCSQGCGGGLNLCGPESICISFTAGAPPGEEDICMLRCSSADATGDAECAALNPATICRDLLTNGPALCSPPCTMGIGCAPPAMCDPGTGRCM